MTNEIVGLAAVVVLGIMLITIYSCCAASGKASEMEEREGRKR